MSFGDGDLHIQVAQLKTENARMKQQLEKLRTLNGELCAEVNAKDAHIRGLKSFIGEISLINADETVRRRMAALGIEVDG